jgi:hypothetical protein
MPRVVHERVRRRRHHRGRVGPEQLHVPLLLPDGDSQDAKSSRPMMTGKLLKDQEAEADVPVIV